MAFCQFSFIKLLHLKVGTIVILFIYLFFNSSYDLSDQQVSKIPHPKNPKKIDSYGRDIWFLTEENELFHWYPVLESLIFKESDVLDFSIGADGTIAITKKDNEVYIRTDKWERISYGNYEHKNVSVYSSYLIYTIDSRNHLIQAFYDSPDTYSWACLDCLKKYYQISCPISQMDDDYSDYRSLWIIGSDHYIYKYSTNKKYIAISESPFKQIKVFNDQYIIGIDINNNLWKYRDGNWVLIRKYVKYATLNYLREIYFIDNDNLVFKMKS